MSYTSFVKFRFLKHLLLESICYTGNKFPVIANAASNISKTSASVSSGFPNTRKQMKARGRWPSAFLVFECLETPMKHEARVFEIPSQSKLKLRVEKETKSLKSMLIKGS